MCIDDNLQCKVIEKTTNEAFQALWLDIEFKTKSNIICGVVYRQHYSYFELNINNINNIKKTWQGINILINRKKKSDKVIQYQFSV